MAPEVTPEIVTNPTTRNDRGIKPHERTDASYTDEADPRLGNALAKWWDKKLGKGWDVRSRKRITTGAGRTFMEVCESTHAGDPINRLAFLRQNSMFIIPVIHFRGKLYTLLCSEYREGAAEELIGFPAESLDKEEDSLKDIALRGLLEETPLNPAWIDDIKEIYAGPQNYVSPGGTNEQTIYMRADVHIPDGFDLETLEGRISGVAEEGERIVAKLTSLQEIHDGLVYELPGVNSKLAFMFLKEELKKEGWF